MSYRLEMLNQGKGYKVTSFRGVWKNLDNGKLVYYTKKGPKLAILLLLCFFYLLSTIPYADWDLLVP